MSEEPRGEILLWSSNVDNGRWKAEVTQCNDTEVTLYITDLFLNEVKYMENMDFVLDIQKGVPNEVLEEWQDKTIMWIDKQDVYEGTEIRMPEEAKIFGDGLVRILNRIQGGWGKGLNFDIGWYGMIIDLDNELANIRFDYTIKQIMEKDGALVLIFDLPTKGFDCCQIFHENNEVPDNDGDIPVEWWAEMSNKFQEHLKTDEHLATAEEFEKEQKELLPDIEEMNEVVARYIEMSITICEACGAPGELETLIWKKTLCPKHLSELEKITPEDIETSKSINQIIAGADFAEVALKEEPIGEGKFIERF